MIVCGVPCLAMPDRPMHFAQLDFVPGLYRPLQEAPPVQLRLCEIGIVLAALQQENHLVSQRREHPGLVAR